MLRKFASGAVTNLVNDNVSIRDYLVLPDGTVLFAGSTMNTGANWTRSLTPAGSLRTLSTVSAPTIARFADGNVYMGLWGEPDFGVKKYLNAENALESAYWISGNTNGVPRTAAHNADAICADSARQTMEGFCGWYGAYHGGTLNTLTSKTFAIAGSPGNSGRTLMQYYPTVERANTVIRNATLAQKVISNVLLAGTDAKGTNLLTVYDTTSKQETIVIDQENEIEIYSMSYVAATDSIMFSGLRFSDNTFVVGDVKLS